MQKFVFFFSVSSCISIVGCNSVLASMLSIISHHSGDVDSLKRYFEMGDLWIHPADSAIVYLCKQLYIPFFFKIFIYFHSDLLFSFR